jgi:hypothetical protein
VEKDMSILNFDPSFRCCASDEEVRDLDNQKRMDKAALEFWASGQYEAIGIKAFNKKEADKMIGYAKRNHSNIKWLITSIMFDK